MESLENKCTNKRLNYDLMRMYLSRVNGKNYGKIDILDDIKEPFENAAKLFSQDILSKIKSGYIKLKSGYTKITYLFSKK